MSNTGRAARPFRFAIGVRPYHGRIPLVRLGGHREGQETGWQCAEREMYEEACLRRSPLAPPATYLADGDDGDAPLEQIDWPPAGEQEPAPLLVVAYPRAEGRGYRCCTWPRRRGSLSHQPRSRGCCCPMRLVSTDRAGNP